MVLDYCALNIFIDTLNLKLYVFGDLNLSELEIHVIEQFLEEIVLRLSPTDIMYTFFRVKIEKFGKRLIETFANLGP